MIVGRICIAVVISTVALAAPAEMFRRAVTQVSSSELAGLASYTQFARAAYCDVSKIQGWKCGGNVVRANRAQHSLIY